LLFAQEKGVILSEAGDSFIVGGEVEGPASPCMSATYYRPLAKEIKWTAIAFGYPKLQPKLPFALPLDTRKVSALNPSQGNRKRGFRAW
jgi:hypothetical protein